MARPRLSVTEILGIAATDQLLTVGHFGGLTFHALLERSNERGLRKDRGPFQVAVMGVRHRHEVGPLIELCVPALAASGILWVIWPERAGKVVNPTDIHPDSLVEIADALGLSYQGCRKLPGVWSAARLEKPAATDELIGPSRSWDFSRRRNRPPG